MHENHDMNMVRNLFPERMKGENTIPRRGDVASFSMNELIETKGRVKVGKTPLELVRVTIESARELIGKIMNELVEKRKFPTK